MNKTLDYYNQQASLYNEMTFSIEFDQKRAFFLKYLQPGAHILDLGCGSGRDSRAFLAQGYRVTAIDGSIELCKIASEQLGHPVRCQRFEELDDEAIYDGVWACASLLHLPTPVLKDTIYRVERALKPGGYFYASFKYGTFEGKRKERYFKDFTEKSFGDFVKDMENIKIEEQWITGDARINRSHEKWLNLILRKRNGAF